MGAFNTDFNSVNLHCPTPPASPALAADACLPRSSTSSVRIAANSAAASAAGDPWAATGSLTSPVLNAPACDSPVLAPPPPPPSSPPPPPPPPHHLRCLVHHLTVAHVEHGSQGV